MIRTITREAFVAAVESATDDPELLATARTQTRFAADHFYARGCGCVVGETRMRLAGERSLKAAAPTVAWNSDRELSWADHDLPGLDMDLSEQEDVGQDIDRAVASAVFGVNFQRGEWDLWELDGGRVVSELVILDGVPA